MSIKILQGMNVIVDGNEYAGTATKVGVVFPEPKLKEINSPGTAGTRKLTTGKWSVEDFKVTFQDYDPFLIGMVGDPNSVDKETVFIGVMGPRDPRTVEITISGNWTSLEGDEWADDSDGSLSYSIHPEVYLLKIDNKEVVFIDVEANEVRLNGKSMTDDLNKRLKRTTGRG